MMNGKGKGTRMGRKGPPTLPFPPRGSAISSVKLTTERIFLPQQTIIHHQTCKRVNMRIHKLAISQIRTAIDTQHSDSSHFHFLHLLESLKYLTFSVMFVIDFLSLLCLLLF